MARNLNRFRQVSGVGSVNDALSGLVPCLIGTARLSETLDPGGTRQEISTELDQLSTGRPADRPFVLLAETSQMGVAPTPAGRHDLLLYCHVPAGRNAVVSLTIESQIKRFALGFQDTIVARLVAPTSDFARYNPNWLGGDINRGPLNLDQMWKRPARM